MKHFLSIFSFTIFVVLLNSCVETENKKLDLSEKNIPVTIGVPKDTEVIENDFMDAENGIYSYTIKNKDLKFIVISDNNFEITKTVEEYNQQVKEISAGDIGFEKFILEETNGYIYVAEGNYKFHYSIIKDGKLIEFMEIQSEKTNEKNAKLAYEIAKTAK